ncbi:MAG: CopG family transcriptional regulator [Halobacteria archaeon]|nr:CopG family transcriptional regulator [Halobacteria archaeon]
MPQKRNKDKIVSFRVSEETFDTLSEIAESQDTTLSNIFREYVDMLVQHDGNVSIVPENRIGEDGEEFPPKVEVPKQVLREQERLELENKHLREQLDEHKEYINYLKDKLENDDVEHVMLENVDSEYR